SRWWSAPRARACASSRGATATRSPASPCPAASRASTCRMRPRSRSTSRAGGSPRRSSSPKERPMSAMRWIVRALLVAAFAAPAGAQQFPTKPVVLVVPYAAGGNVDVSTRALQAGLGNSLGQPIVVENRPGGGGTIAGQYVARAAPDGHTLLVGSNGPVMLGPMTMTNPPYRWQDAFTPVSTLAIATNTLVVRSTLPVKTVAELVA